MPPISTFPEDERALLLLGLLMAQDRHGYELHDFIEHNLGHVLPLKKATAYQLLDRLEARGLVDSRAEQHGLRPSRKVYAINAAGRASFRELLAQQLSREEALILPGNVSIMFSEHLPRETVVAGLRTRLAKLDARLAIYAGYTFPFPEGVALAIERIRVLTRADRDWLAATLERLEGERAGHGKTP
ncbi:PadR family transcriptional regulator [Deinococcus hopiensis]|uniref:DNA-binding transcriptional regulator, PadR family n=1 Tax=Deinococcus hopiensis KR-140 TaxID=695939 RepID=A0A1W1UCP6_9DEIO|nr:PadR family transcriptional regulator [Deinococcus hopiensis]SMB78813.1 DNA-binding transcriptional regulator, PadR family [Deinococcus hopiensis KR-140]